MGRLGKDCENERIQNPQRICEKKKRDESVERGGLLLDKSTCMLFFKEG